MSTEIIIGDCLAALKQMRAGSVHCVVTSPPYFGLRDYQTATWEGGSPDCDHKIKVQPRTERPQGKLNSLAYVDEAQVISRGNCPRCGATRTDEQIGLEESPELYVEHLVDVCREVHRVLRDDGTFWLNLGDSYARTGGTDRQGSRSAKAGNTRRTMEAISDRTQRAPQGLKDKDLIGIPWMVAFALRADGWYLRRDIIWSKPNPMPESITDRCTSSHEYIFMLTKRGKPTFWLHRDGVGARKRPEPDYRWVDHVSDDAETEIEPENWRAERLPSDKRQKRWSRINLWDSFDYYYDAEAIAEPVAAGTVLRLSQPNLDNQEGSARANAGAKTNGNMKAIKPTLVSRAGNSVRKPGEERGAPGGVASSVPWAGTMRNKRSVWTVTTVPFKGAHFATFPRKLITPCILAGTSATACEICGAPWGRVTESRRIRRDEFEPGDPKYRPAQYEGAYEEINGKGDAGYRETTTLGWAATCECGGTGSALCTVLDPFGGAGTTAIVSESLGRNAIIIELNADYAKLAQDRIHNEPLVFEHLR